MKKQYDAPKTEVILLEEENIILTSVESVARLTSMTNGENADRNPGGAGDAF